LTLRPHRPLALCLATGGAALLLLAACRRAEPVASVPDRLQPAAGEFSVMTYNVRRYCYDDRDRDGQRNDPKPPAEVRALVEVVTRARPDVLALQEMGSEPLLEEFRGKLRTAGLDYPYADYLPAPNTNVNLGVLSMFPIVGRKSVTNETYTIGETTLPVQRGFQALDLQVSTDYRFRLINVHLKSKVFSYHGQTEMRRNEARLLNKHVRRFLADEPGLNLLVVGDFNDQRGSAALREVLGRELSDLRPRDQFGDYWTHLWEDEETYSRIDYLLVNTNMLREVVEPKTRAVRDPACAGASDHRPLFGVFVARDR
jgi:endonuclease/exonuclease/phosphatase family metal-dependent hydrolase